ncbi:hypothetical protein ACS0TY_015601 [Phlomoides rotata]
MGLQLPGSRVVGDTVYTTYCRRVKGSVTAVRRKPRVVVPTPRDITLESHRRILSLNISLVYICFISLYLYCVINSPVLYIDDMYVNLTAGFTISFVNTDHFHSRLIDEPAFRRRCLGVEFLSIPDGLPPDHTRIGPSFVDLFLSITAASKPVLRYMIADMTHAPSCIISDGLMSFANDVAEELGIPAISFRTDSAAATWSYFHFDKLIEEGEMPVLEERGDMDKLVACIPGLENIVRRRDLPTMCKLDPEGPILQFFNTQTSKMRKASALILNTFEELESPIISHRSTQSSLQFMQLGPGTDPENYQRGGTSGGSRNLERAPSAPLQVDQSCIEWLDSQPPNSVLYVSFGTRAVLSRDELMEFWHGAVVEKMARELMEGDREELMKSMAEIARLTQNSVRDGGSSRADLKKLIEDIKLLDSNKMGFNVDN